MADKDRFGKSSRSYAVDTPRERGIKKYHRNLSKGLGSGRNVRRIRKAREDYKLNRPPRWDQKVGKAVRSGFGKGKEGIMGLWDAGMKGLNAATNSWAEAQEARKDDKKWTYGGDPLDMAPGSMAHKWMQTQVLPEFQEDFEEEVSKGNLHWTELGDFTGGQSGLAERINVLNNLTPERLEGYSPIKQRNILESIVNPAEADAFRRSDAGQEGILNNAMLMDYINQAKELYGNAGLPAINTPSHINQTTGVAPIDIEYLRDERKGGHLRPKDLEPIPAFAYDETDISVDPTSWTSLWNQQPGFDEPDWDPLYENERKAANFNAGDVYGNLTMDGIRNKFFPGMALEDITEDDINAAIAMGNTGFMTSPQLNQLYQ